MPIYEYVCASCGNEFEALVRGSKLPTCTACGSADLKRRPSLPSVKSESTRAQSLRAARKRDKQLGNERVQEQIRYERNHD